MPKRNVTSSFTFTHPNGEKEAFGVGDVVESPLADHWYVQAHSEVETAKTARGGNKPSLSTSVSSGLSTAESGISSLSTSISTAA